MKLQACRLIFFVCTTLPVAGQAPESIYVNAKIVTVDARFPIVEAMAVSGGKFTAVGRSAGGVMGAEQKITRQEALRISTVNNAFLTFEEKTKGSIEPGKLADFVVLAEDIPTVPEKRIEQMKVLMTVVGGKAVFAADERR